MTGTSENDYDVMEKIGHGSFGVIRKVRRKADGQIQCRKEINYFKMSQKEREQLHAEFAILSSLRHPNIVGYYHREHLKSSQDLHLYMEYCGNGDLGRVIKDLQAKKQLAEEGFVWSMFSQLLTALYRCHYGVDPPEIGSNIMGLGNTAKPKNPSGGVMILHRDLKPENVFLGEDNSVKLGDFGLSKIMESHDFASTYVGTPFYMSPEICAAERYTLKSDIWSLGCIIYELCSKEPPFNAKTHLQLVQRIKEGKIAPIPSVYSPELFAVIKDCLRVNPDRRPDTATLLNLPVVKLMRKEKEVVELGRALKKREDQADQRLRDADQKLREANEKLRHADQKLSSLENDINESLKLEWELKAKLVIDQNVAMEMDKLQKEFEIQLQKRVAEEVGRRMGDGQAASGFSLSGPRGDFPQSSVSTSADGEFPSTTDISEFSVDSPDSSRPLKRSSRTPFTRAQTFANGAGTPMDVEMADPSPMSISSLSLSPRRRDGTQAPHLGKLLFKKNLDEKRGAGAEDLWRNSTAAGMASDTEDDDDLPGLPSPTRAKPSRNNPFKTRPHLVSHKTAPLPKLQAHSSDFLAAPKPATAQTHLPSTHSQPDLVRRSPSPSRRLSKIPSSSNLHAAADSSPTRKPSLTRKNTLSAASIPASELGKLASKSNSNLRPTATTANSAPPLSAAPIGRSLVELSQARAPGRNLHTESSPAAAGRKFAERAAMREELRGCAPVYDPERDEMPSPFLVKRAGLLRR